MADKICSQELPEINCTPDGFLKNGILEIKCNDSIGLFVAGSNRIGKSMHDLNINFSIAGRRARALRKQLKKYDYPKPYKYYGERYNNLSLKKKLVAKFILKITYKH